MTLSSSNSLMKLVIVALAIPFGIKRSEGLHLKSRGLIKSLRLRDELLPGRKNRRLRGSDNPQAHHLQTTTMNGKGKEVIQDEVAEILGGEQKEPNSIDYYAYVFLCRAGIFK